MNICESYISKRSETFPIAPLGCHPARGTVPTSALLYYVASAWRGLVVAWGKAGPRSNYQHSPGLASCSMPANTQNNWKLPTKDLIILLFALKSIITKLLLINLCHSGGCLFGGMFPGNGAWGTRSRDYVCHVTGDVAWYDPRLYIGWRSSAPCHWVTVRRLVRLCQIEQLKTLQRRHFEFGQKLKYFECFVNRTTVTLAQVCNHSYFTLYPV